MGDYKFLAWFLPLVVIFFTFWDSNWSQWVVLLAALILFFQGIGSCKTRGPSIAKPRVRRRRR